MILDDLDRIAGYTTPSVLAELLTMMNYRGPLNPTWVDTVHSREGGVLYPAGLCYLKNSAYFIATRTQARWVWLARVWVGVVYIGFWWVWLVGVACEGMSECGYDGCGLRE